MTPSGFATAPPVLRGVDATTTLADVSLVTFAVDPDALAAALPAGVRPDVVTLDDGRRRALVSAVSFRDVDFRLAVASGLRFSFLQTNYRAYVRVGDRRLVWFFGTTLDSPLVAVPRFAWQMPWHRDAMRLKAAWDGDRCRDYRLRTRGAWGGADVDLEGTDERVGRLDGFADANETLLVLTHPLAGMYRRQDGGLGGYSVWHERFAPRLGIARTARYDVFERLGLVKAAAVPHSVMLQRTIDFAVLLPPIRLPEPLASR
ncbi:MAG TPA: DUF2071 domain-containing protein [Candidatus Limnocylindrales bacterium]